RPCAARCARTARRPRRPGPAAARRAPARAVGRKGRRAPRASAPGTTPPDARSREEGGLTAEPRTAPRLHSSLALVPVRADARLHLQRHVERERVLHEILHERARLLLPIGGHLEDKLV